MFSFTTRLSVLMKLPSSMRTFALLLACVALPPESSEAFTFTNTNTNMGVYNSRRNVASMMVDKKTEGVSERNAKLLAQAERLRAEGHTCCFHHILFYSLLTS